LALTGHAAHFLSAPEASELLATLGRTQAYRPCSHGPAIRVTGRGATLNASCRSRPLPAVKSRGRMKHHFHAAVLFGLEVLMEIRELMPQDRKIEVEQLTSEEAIEVAGFLAAVVGRGHSRQMDAATRKQWLGELQHGRSKSLKAPGWLWSSVVELLVDHERGYLDHCRGLEGV
jgi:Uncharacterized protein conserved in bacteria (DUF2252)